MFKANFKLDSRAQKCIFVGPNRTTGPSPACNPLLNAVIKKILCARFFEMFEATDIVLLSDPVKPVEPENHKLQMDMSMLSVTPLEIVPDQST